MSFKYERLRTKIVKIIKRKTNGKGISGIRRATVSRQPVQNESANGSGGVARADKFKPCKKNPRSGNPARRSGSE